MDRRLLQAARAPLASEIGALHVNPAGRLRTCLCYPNTYHLGMSNLGYQQVYWLLNQHPRVACDRAFLPEPRLLPRYRTTRTPIVGLETGRPLRDFPVLGFSLNFELDYPHLPLMLSLSGVPPLAADRSPADPLVILGGPAPSYNPEPLADFADLVLIGEAEEAIAPLADLLAAWALDGALSRAELLERLSAQPGCYVPTRYRVSYGEDGQPAVAPLPGAQPHVPRLWTRDLDAWPVCSRLLTPATEFGHLFLLELSRGCGHGCRFCVASYCYRPPRRRSLPLLLELARQGLAHRDTVGLLAAAVSDYPQLDQLCSGIISAGGKVTLASLRADCLTPGLMRCLEASGTHSLTLAPEAGTDRLRMVIHKGIGEEDYLRAARLAYQHGVRALKLYFIIGLPTETDEDVAAIPDFVRRLRAAAPLALTVSAGPLVPKPGTPFQREAMLPPAQVRARLARIRSALAREPYVDLAFESPTWSFLQGALARGDRRLAPVLLAASQDPGRSAAWLAAFRQHGLDPAWYALRPRPPHEPLPWQHLG